jgi:ssDNA-binding Zn-finger/Zn-ribbon topoisomerase 1
MTACIAGCVIDRVIAKEIATKKTNVEMGICPRCKKPLNLSHPDAMDYKGQRFHSECAEKAGALANSLKAKPSNL